MHVSCEFATEQIKGAIATNPWLYPNIQNFDLFFLEPKNTQYGQQYAVIDNKTGLNFLAQLSFSYLLKRLNRYLARLLRRLERGERLLQVVGVRLHAPVENTILNLMRTTQF